MKYLIILLSAITCMFSCKRKKPPEQSEQKTVQYTPGWVGETNKNRIGIYGESFDTALRLKGDSGYELRIKSESWKTGEYFILKNGTSIKKQ